MPAPTPSKGPRDDRPVARHYTWKEVGVMLLTFAALGVLLDSGGLVTWANRLKVGPAQAFWLKVLTPVDHALSRVHLDRPREVLIATSDRWTSKYAPSVEDAPQPALDAPLATASPAPLSNEIDGPLGKLHLPASHDEVELPGLPDDGPAPAPTPSGPTQVTVLLVGDSMMQIGLAPGIAKAFAQDPHVRVLRVTHPGTGLSRPDVFDWPHELAGVVVHEKPRFVVATFGGNDAQDMRVGGQAIAFGTSTWDAAYTERVRALMEELTRDGAEVLWVSLPPMRSADFNERVGKLNDLTVAAAKSVRHVEVLDATPLVTAGDRTFATYLPAPGGGLVQVRQEDGIHLSSAGGERVATEAVGWIKSRAIAGAGAAMLTSPASPGLASDPRPGG